MKNNNQNYNYTRIDLKKKLIRLGLKKNDLVFIHSNLAFFGKIKSKENPCKIFLNEILKIIGKNGTLVVPTFTYSMNAIYDVKKTPSVCGVFSEYVRKSKQGIRSLDPIFSIYSIGKYSKYLTNISSIDGHQCFGKNSFFEKFYKLNGKIINFNETCASTHIHYFEKKLKVNYRKDKKFLIKLKIQKLYKTKKIIFYCVKNLKKIEARFDKFHNFAIEEKLAKEIKLGLGIITYMKIKNMEKLVYKNAGRKNFLYKMLKNF